MQKRNEDNKLITEHFEFIESIQTKKLKAPISSGRSYSNQDVVKMLSSSMSDEEIKVKSGLSMRKIRKARRLANILND